MVINWITTDKDKDNTLVYCRKKSGKVTWNHVQATHTVLPHKEAHLLHTIELRNLLPDSKYQFRIAKSKTLHYFRTMPLNLNEPIRFIVGADAKSTHSKRFKAMCQVAARQDPRFVLLAGDLAYSVENKTAYPENFARWVSFFKNWSSEMRDTSGCIIPLFVTIGNHEVFGGHNRKVKDAPLYYALFKKSFYDFGFGDYVHFTFLDSAHTHTIKEQTSWLKNTLKKSSHFLHRFALYHVGAYPSTGRFSDPTRKDIRKYWVPLFEKYQLSGCFEGHDHAYKRTYPLKNGKAHPKGIVYFGDGSWGITPREPSSRKYIAQSKGCQQALLVEISMKACKYTAIDVDGVVIDSYMRPSRPFQK